MVVGPFVSLVDTRLTRESRTRRSIIFSARPSLGRRLVVSKRQTYGGTMRRTGVAITVVLALCSLIVAHAQISGVPRSIFYDSFMQQDIEDRLGTFNLISPGERAGLD